MPKPAPNAPPSLDYNPYNGLLDVWLNPSSWWEELQKDPYEWYAARGLGDWYLYGMTAADAALTALTLGAKQPGALLPVTSRTIKFGTLPPGVLGSTDSLGHITVARGLRGAALRKTVRHETVHSVLTPRPPLNRVTVGLHHQSAIYRFVEEAIAEGYATRSVSQGLRYAIRPDVVPVSHLAYEATAVGAAGYGVYQLTR